jgi:hypothetical protein
LEQEENVNILRSNMDNIINNCVRKIINFLYNHFFKNTNIFYFY